MVILLTFTMVLCCLNIGSYSKASGSVSAQTVATDTDSGATVSEDNAGENSTSENTYSSENFDVNFKLDNVWDAGYNATITITNTSDSIIENWCLTFPLNETISDIWNATISETHNDFYVIKNAGWNQDIAVGKSVSFGITVYEPFSEYPEYYSILGNEVETKSEDYTVDYKITEDWGDGYKAAVTITNNKATAIEDWRLTFSYGDNLITQMWNAVILNNTDGTYQLGCETYNQNIAPGASITFGFMVEPGCSGKLMENVVLREYVATGDNAGEDTDDGTEDDDNQNQADSDHIAIINGYVEDTSNVLNLEVMASMECTKFEFYASKNETDYELIGTGDEDGFMEYILGNDFSNIDIYALCYNEVGVELESNHIKVYNINGVYEVPDPDTDNDGLDDYHELFICFTDYRLSDSDNNDIMDCDEDLDDDGLTNIEEYEYSSHPLLEDSDGDELGDYDELFVYFTDVNLKDSDEDGANDKWELDNGRNPMMFDESFDISATATSTDITASAYMNVSGEMVETLIVEPVSEHYFINETVPGYIGSPFNFKIDGDFESATISFEFDEALLANENFVPTIYYFNDETQFLEELPTTVEGNVASTKTTHFSTYVLLEKSSYEDAWEDIKAPKGKGNIEEINVVFVVDASESMYGTKFRTAKQAVQNFVEEIKTNKIKTNVGLVRFSGKATVLSGLTDDYESFFTALGKMQAKGSTAIYTGLEEGIKLHVNNESETNSYDVIILLSDGYDESQEDEETYDNLIKMAKAMEIEIYTVGIGTIDEELLLKIANGTEGRFLYADGTSALYTIYEEILTEVVDYTTDSNHDGISDYYTRLLCEGKLRIGTQGNIFEGISYAKVNASKDYDGDGLINGDELKIYQDNDTGYVYVYLYSNPFLRDSDGDGIWDSVDKAPLDPSSTYFLIYETKDPYTDEFLKTGEYDSLPEDYYYGDKTKEELIAMKYIGNSDFDGKKKYDYIDAWKSIAKKYSKGKMQDVAIDMVNHSLDWSGTDYFNDVLTSNVVKHKKSIEYVNVTKECVKEYIEDNNGNIYGLLYDENNRDSSVVKEHFRKGGIDEPRFNNALSGLGFCLHGLYGNQIEIVSYKYDGKNYECTLKFTYYDVFGLDSVDIEENSFLGVKFGEKIGFRSWYILQHYEEFDGEVRPFITYITFEETIKGSIE